MYSSQSNNSCIYQRPFSFNFTRKGACSQFIYSCVFRGIEYRYFISSLKADIEQISRAVRGHWSIESMHWHLDVTFREDANTTLDKMAAQNLNIIRKWSLSILKPAQMTRHKLSMRKKRFVVSMRPIQYLEELLEA